LGSTVAWREHVLTQPSAKRFRHCGSAHHRGRPHVL
jgi:hypothetical protein